MRLLDLFQLTCFVCLMTACQHAKSNKQNNNEPPTSPTSPNPNDPSLPSYLYTLTEARAIQPWAEAYIPTRQTATIPPSVPAGEALRSYMESFINRMMKLEVVKPGRTLRLTIAKDKTQNAYADGRQNVVVQTGLFAGLTSTDILGILCHEMTHSLRNDSKNMEDYMTNTFIVDPKKNPKAAVFFTNVEAYLNKQYNSQTRVYVHNTAAYRQVLAQWSDFRQDYWQYAKRLESTADVIGGGICASVGMSPEDFKQNFVRLKAIVGDATADDVLQDGERYRFNSGEELFSALFIDKDHPSFDERISQLERLKPFLNEYLAKDASLIQEWQSNLASMVSNSSSSLNLAGQTPLAPHTIRVELENGSGSVVLKTNDGPYAPKLPTP